MDIPVQAAEFHEVSALEVKHFDLYEKGHSFAPIMAAALQIVTALESQGNSIMNLTLSPYITPESTGGTLFVSYLTAQADTGD